VYLKIRQKRIDTAILGKNWKAEKVSYSKGVKSKAPVKVGKE